MEKLSSTLKHLLNEAKISEAELARRTGIAQPMVNRLATGKNKNPKLETLKPIAKYFSVTFSQLLGEEELPSSELRSNQIITTADSQTFELMLVNLDEVNPDNLISEKLVTTTANVSNKAFAVLINSDELEPRFSNNTLLTIDPEAAYNTNDFVLISNSETAKTTLMQVKSTENNNVVLQSLDSTLATISLDTAKHKILGVLVQAKHDFR